MRTFGRIDHQGIARMRMGNQRHVLAIQPKTSRYVEMNEMSSIAKKKHELSPLPMQSSKKPLSSLDLRPQRNEAPFCFQS